jgi:hypothetical protein
MPEFPETSQQFRDDPKIRQATKSKGLLKEVEEGGPGPIWKYLMEHSTPIKDGEHHDAPPRDVKNKKQHQGKKQGQNLGNHQHDDEDDEQLSDGPKNVNGGRKKFQDGPKNLNKFKNIKKPLNDGPRFKNNRHRRPNQATTEVPQVTTELPEDDERFNDDKPENNKRPSEESEAFFDDDDDFDDERPKKTSPKPALNDDHRPNKNNKRRPFGKGDRKPGGSGLKFVSDGPAKIHVIDDSPLNDPVLDLAVDDVNVDDSDGDDVDSPPHRNKNKPAFIPTAYEIHVQPVIATSSFKDADQLLNSVQNDRPRRKKPEFNVPVPNFPDHVDFGNGAFRLVHQTDWTPIAADPGKQPRGSWSIDYDSSTLRVQSSGTKQTYTSSHRGD